MPNGAETHKKIPILNPGFDQIRKYFKHYEEKGVSSNLHMLYYQIRCVTFNITKIFSFCYFVVYF